MNDLTSKYVGKSGKWNPNLLFLEKEIRNYRILALPGGTRSGKTTAVIQFLWRQMSKYSGVEYSITRRTLTALKSTVLRDFVEIGTAAGLYDEDLHNCGDKTYRWHGNLLDYFGADDHEKVRGGKRKLIYMNEAPEMDWPVVQQLLWRTEHKVIIDYNPSYPESWVYDKILTRKDCAMITTTYKDNPHLPPGQVAEIEWLKENDPEAYKVYGLGQRGELKGQIYKNWKRIKELPIDYPHITVIDFGFSNDPTAISRFCKHNRALYGKQLVYQTGLDNLDIGIHLFFHGVGPNDMVIGDSAEPKSIAELRYGWGLDDEFLKKKMAKNGYTDFTQTGALLEALKKGFPGTMGAIKGQDSIDAGIQKLKQFEVFITEDSHDAWKEYSKYKWAEDPKTGDLLNVPVDEWNHFMDTARMFALAEGRLF